jgi:anti-sigma factor RsiW
MSCSPFDLRDYLLKELPDQDSRQVELHLRSCQGCLAEFDALRVTEAALLTLRDEEIPQRIAFVSDKIFEPSPLRRWWQAFWASGARLGFASAAMLSAALLVSALTRPPAPAPVTLSPNAQVTAAAVQSEIDRRVTQAIAKASADIEAKQMKKTAEIVAALEKRNEMDRQSLVLAMEKNFEFMSKRLSRFTIASAGYGPPSREEGEAK